MLMIVHQKDFFIEYYTKMLKMLYRLRLVKVKRNIIEESCIQNFFCQEAESDKNFNKLDNLIFINKVIPSELLSVITAPDRFELLQMIAVKNGMDEIPYFYSGLEEKKKVNNKL